MKEIIKVKAERDNCILSNKVLRKDYLHWRRMSYSKDYMWNQSEDSQICPCFSSLKIQNKLFHCLRKQKRDYRKTNLIDFISNSN